MWGGAIVGGSLNLHAEFTKEVLERGPHHRRVQAVWQYTNEVGELVSQTNQWTEFANGLHYREDGEWRESQALVEQHPDGAVAVKGRHQAIFSTDLNSEGAIDMLASDDQRLLFHPLALRWANAATGERTVFAVIQSSIGEILPPNQVIYRDCFDGVEADLVYTYTPAFLESDVVLLENPDLPAGYDPDTTRLEVVTEFLQPPVPELDQNILKKETDPLMREVMAEPDLIDNSIDFGAMRIVLGTAFLWPEGQNGPRIPVGKRWIEENGRFFLIEAVDYSDIEPYLETLQASRPQENKAVAMDLPSKEQTKPLKQPMEVAQNKHRRAGFVIDAEIVEDKQSMTFAEDITYRVITNAWITESTTFESGTVLKYDEGTKLTLSGSVTTPSASGRPPPPACPAILTARDDHHVGERITDAEGKLPPLSGDYYADTALEAYNVDDQTSFKNLQIRHAQEAIYDYSGSSTHYVYDTRFIECGIAVTGYYTDLDLSEWILCNVETNYHNDGGATFSVDSATIIERCDLLVNDRSQDTSENDLAEQMQRESTIVATDAALVIAFGDLGGSDPSAPYATGYARSTDGGASFVDKGYIPHGPFSEPAGYDGERADPVMAYDGYYDYTYLVCRGPSTAGNELRFFRSDNDGEHFKDLIINSAPGFSQSEEELDKPWIDVDTNSGSEQGNIYQVFKSLDAVYFSRSTDHGDTWDDGTGDTNDSYMVNSTTNNLELAFPFVTVGNNHEVYLFWYKRTEVGGSPVSEIKGKRSTDGCQTWTQLADIPLDSPGDFGVDNTWFLDIHVSSTDNTVIRNICQPQAVVHPTSGNIYMVYPDKGEQTGDQADIFMRYSTDRGDSWSSSIRVNDDTGDHDQWCPSIAMKPDGSELFVGFYDRRCNSTNTLIHTFGRIGTPSASGITFDPNFQISDSSFFHEQNNGNTPMTDYDMAAADNQYFYYCWTDQRHPYYFNIPEYYRNEMDIRFVKIK